MPKRLRHRYLPKSFLVPLGIGPASSVYHVMLRVCHTPQGTHPPPPPPVRGVTRDVFYGDSLRSRGTLS